MTQTPDLAGSNASDQQELTVPTLSQWQIFVRFLRFGLLAWGGPVAQIAMIRRELVDEERWISSGRFNRLLAVYQVLPGPEAHELCVHIGMLPGGRMGGFLAGLGFMLPGFLLMFALSWLYFTIDITQSALGPIFLGVQVAVIALIVRAVHRIGGHVLLDKWLWGIGIVSGAAAFLGASFWITLPAAGLVYAFAVRKQHALAALTLVAATVLTVLVGPESATGLLDSAQQSTALSDGSIAQDASLVGLFLSGLKAGLLTFGGAYTVIPFLRDDAVGNGWMTDAQFLDGLALSGILPAPLIIFSTFVGYFGGGPLGAIAMTIGIFLPAFGFSLLFHERLESLVENKTLHSFLEGVSAGVVGLIAATTVELALVVVDRLPSLLLGGVIFALALAVLYLWKSRVNVVLAVVGAGFLGWLGFGLLLG
ncbi:chromate transporter [Agrobacterium salinitolerans]|jgi:chromate transporter|uniref:Chromate transporter n=2 Tax=Hyphomicrobiales TaxID=356 RepID=A0A9E7A9T5_9HYPH|nr:MULTISPECIES: chromate transporter [Hyphomicrobiales]MCH4543758.1 chromate transporter [Ochrobactrum sp. A-1]UOK73414.1 chromate transporter [Ancylobacter polymorphus]GHE76061.1 chromate transporter [Camelimonas fluminis]CDN96160.1 Chromate transporter, chromate ion transporter family [Agrobacterium tumefaciens]